MKTRPGKDPERTCRTCHRDYMRDYMRRGAVGRLVTKALEMGWDVARTADGRTVLTSPEKKGADSAAARNRQVAGLVEGLGDQRQGVAVDGGESAGLVAMAPVWTPPTVGGLTARELAMRMFDVAGPDYNQVAKAYRRLEKLIRSGELERKDGYGREPHRYYRRPGTFTRSGTA